MVRTLDSHSSNRGSIPRIATKALISILSKIPVSLPNFPFHLKPIAPWQGAGFEEDWGYASNNDYRDDKHF
jgi:hypothetical protein